MYNEKSILAIIPARGGSKSIPRKNLRLLKGKPLLGWTIETAQNSQYIDRVILSSEDEEIINTAKKYGCEVPFVRPAELARDQTPGIDTVLHAITNINVMYDYVLLLQCTSPLRTTNDIDGCLEFCIEAKANSCVSVAETIERPFWMYTIDNEQRLKQLIYSEKHLYQRQQLPKVYLLNGAIYIARSEWLLENRSFINEDTLAYAMPRERSLDIDEEYDLQIAEFLFDRMFYCKNNKER